ncbi:MAG TPA: glycosyltransferase family 87 protein, partial [Phycisphaerae bacterium]|nr:glycosyltransferase family 87 protein [Phycisphaerae bacterium]
DEVRYQHWRPVAERLLYWQFLAFGRNAIGYRVINMALYGLGVIGALMLFRRIGLGEAAARWGALGFAAAACHAVPVVFVSSQADLISLVLVIVALVAAMRYSEERDFGASAVATLAFAISLGTKEATLAMVFAPLLLAYGRGTQRKQPPPYAAAPGSGKRAIVLSLIWTGVGLAWLAFYARGGYGSNAAVMLEPMRDPMRYLAALPGRALTLLVSLLIPINPFLFYLRSSYGIGLYGFLAIGLLPLGWAAWETCRRHAKNRIARSMVLFVLIFLPLLVCTVPDDRILMLPSIGFYALLGMWAVPGGLPGNASTAPLAGRHEAGRSRMSSLVPPFIVLQAVAAMLVTHAMGRIEIEGRESLLAPINQFGRPLQAGDCMFVVNDTTDANVLFAQLRLEAIAGRRDIYVAFLCNTSNPEVRRIDEHTLHLTATDEPFFGGFLGDMARPTDRPYQEGETFRARELTGRIVRVNDGEVREIEIRFDKPINSDSYRFYSSPEWGRPARIQIP